MEIASFPYETKTSSIFKLIKRPIAQVSLFSAKREKWLKYTMIVDTGADYTVFPFKVSRDLGIDVEKECDQYFTSGVGGTEKVFIYKKKIFAKIGKAEQKIPIGFLERDDLPPLLGRQQCLDAFAVLFSKFVATFSRK